MHQGTADSHQETAERYALALQDVEKNFGSGWVSKYTENSWMNNQGSEGVYYRNYLYHNLWMKESSHLILNHVLRVFDDVKTATRFHQDETCITHQSEMFVSGTNTVLTFPSTFDFALPQGALAFEGPPEHMKRTFSIGVICVLFQKENMVHKLFLSFPNKKEKTHRRIARNMTKQCIQLVLSKYSNGF